MESANERKACAAPDGVEIVYSAAGSGEPALVFIHGGLANRSFWDGEVETFASRHHVMAPDLPGHGESGTNRQKWGIPEFGADIRAVIEAEHAEKVILFGNSLGGAVAIEAALLIPERVLGVVGVDTFHSLTYSVSQEEATRMADAFRNDYADSLRKMVRQLFHNDADPAIVADAERRMAHTSPMAAYSMFLCIAGYKPSESASLLRVPVRAINGDLFPTDTESVRKIAPDFDVLLMSHVGHYPMLEQPQEFDRLVGQTINSLTK
ncbi:MAG TPA: alpha/beta hydrolase [Candidatus Solibacter sp.]|nr:alpha/beta hydrolase [Candidatus Solibacter sp.]